MIGRRTFTTLLAAALAGTVRPARAATLPEALAAIEAASGGRLGVAMRDTAGASPPVGHRLEERFPMCSTFKVLAASAILARVDAGTEHLDRRVRFAVADVVPGSPLTEPNAGGPGMTLAALCEAAITRSDNTAANLMLARIGGPAGVTRFARSLGDSQTRLDRTEPTLNEALADDPRDTTTPAAMLQDLERLVLGDALSAASRAQLTRWMLANQTGGARLRAGVPADWRVADKTGTGERGTANDVGVLWPPGRKPVLVAVYLTGAAGPMARQDAAIAAAARAVVDALGSRG